MDAHYEVRWGDDRGSSMSLDLPPLDEDLVVAIAGGIRDWWYKAPNWSKDKRFVRLIKVETTTTITQVGLPKAGRRTE